MISSINHITLAATDLDKSGVGWHSIQARGVSPPFSG